MRSGRLMRCGALIAMGACLFQTTGCSFEEFNSFVQTVLLGITAAGSIAILRNI